MELGITEKEHNIILNILKEYFDKYAFYYYGSRIKGTFNKTSDLDILIKGNQEMPLRDLVEIKEKFDESKLPYIVNFADYNSIDEKFYNLIKDDLVLVEGFEVLGKDNMVSNIKLNKCLKMAVSEFYKNDSMLVGNVDGMERTCVSKIVIYLNKIIETDEDFSELNLDVEYNKCNTGTKKLDNKPVIPDLIIHQRNLNNPIANPYNTLVVEFKGCWNDNMDDIEKLKKFTSPYFEYIYQLGIFVKLGRSEASTEYRYFKNGQEVKENDL